MLNLNWEKPAHKADITDSVLLLVSSFKDCPWCQYIELWFFSALNYHRRNTLKTGPLSPFTDYEEPFILFCYSPIDVNPRLSLNSVAGRFVSADWVILCSHIWISGTLKVPGFPCWAILAQELFCPLFPFQEIFISYKNRTLYGVQPKILMSGILLHY